MNIAKPTSPHAPSKVHMIRLSPRQDLKRCLQQFAADHHLTAAIILTCVGSLEQYNLRFANQREATLRKGPFEIVSLTGTLSQTSAHLHLCVSDHAGVTTGGHLLPDNLIFTTAEIGIAELTGLEFNRVYDPASGYPELEIRTRR